MPDIGRCSVGEHERWIRGLGRVTLPHRRVTDRRNQGAQPGKCGDHRHQEHRAIRLWRSSRDFAGHPGLGSNSRRRTTAPATRANPPPRCGPDRRSRERPPHRPGNEVVAVQPSEQVARRGDQGEDVERVAHPVGRVVDDHRVEGEDDHEEKARGSADPSSPARRVSDRRRPPKRRR